MSEWYYYVVLFVAVYDELRERERERERENRKLSFLFGLSREISVPTSDDLQPSFVSAAPSSKQTDGFKMNRALNKSSLRQLVRVATVLTLFFSNYELLTKNTEHFSLTLLCFCNSCRTHRQLASQFRCNITLVSAFLLVWCYCF